MFWLCSEWLRPDSVWIDEGHTWSGTKKGSSERFPANRVIYVRVWGVRLISREWAEPRDDLCVWDRSSSKDRDHCDRTRAINYTHPPPPTTIRSILYCIMFWMALDLPLSQVRWKFRMFSFLKLLFGLFLLIFFFFCRFYRDRFDFVWFVCCIVVKVSSKFTFDCVQF